MLYDQTFVEILLLFIFWIVIVSYAFRGWDIRNTESPVFSFKGHQYAVKRLKVWIKYVYLTKANCPIFFMKLLLKKKVSDKMLYRPFAIRHFND